MRRLEGSRRRLRRTAADRVWKPIAGPNLESRPREGPASASRRQCTTANKSHAITPECGVKNTKVLQHPSHGASRQDFRPLALKLPLSGMVGNHGEHPAIPPYKRTHFLRPGRSTITNGCHGSASRGVQGADDGPRVPLDDGHVGTDGDLGAPPALLPVLQRAHVESK
jgi:hypothetical protein